MKIKIQENFSENIAKVFFGEEEIEYNFNGLTTSHIFGYPYFDFLWLNENAEEGSEYTLKTSNDLNLNIVYKKIKTKKQGPFFHIEIEEEGNLNFGGESYEFKREIEDNYPCEDGIMKMVKKGKYEHFRSSSVLTTVGDYKEKITKNQYFDSQNYHKFVNVEGKGNIPRINEALKSLYPARKLLPDFDKEKFDIDLNIIERVIKRNGIRDQIFEKLIFQLDENENPTKAIAVVEEFWKDKSDKEIYRINLEEDKVVSAISTVI